MRTLLAAPLLLAGCLSHMPRDARPDHVALPWRPDFESARCAAAQSGKPILLCLVAGDITDHC